MKASTFIVLLFLVLLIMFCHFVIVFLQSQNMSSKMTMDQTSKKEMTQEAGDMESNTNTLKNV